MTLPKRRGATGRVGARPSSAGGARPPSVRVPSSRGPAPPPTGYDQDPEGAPRSGGRGAPQEAGPDKRLIWGAVGAGVLIVGVVVALNVGEDGPAVRKETGKGEGKESAVEKFPDANTPEGREEIRKMFDRADPAKLRRYIGGITPETALKIKDTLIPYMLRQDTGAGFTDAYNLAILLANAKDERVLAKIIDLGLKKEDAHSLLKPYGAMASAAVIARAEAAGGENIETFTKMLIECKLEEANPPIVAAAEGSSVPPVAWMCGDVLYLRRIPIRLERVQSWLADPDVRAVASGIRQMSLQKNADRNAALAPFANVDAKLEAKKALIKVLARDATLDHGLMRTLLNDPELEIFEECVGEIVMNRLFEYIPDLEKFSESAGTVRGRRAGTAADQLKGIRKLR